ncbi:STAS domain-containing protein [Desulfocurvibacter africanus]|uniref:STAS domain-containing protein n=1 Tax=Desulfocurvibacter africanus TaxID=873 RepID=UPI000401EA69|nr:STAS domain-containing protein [Desulfocurvibacter africanus]
MEFIGTPVGDSLVLAVKGRMDVTSSPKFEKECQTWLDKGQKRMVADLSGLEYISSAGLRSILVVGKRLKASGGGLSLCGLKGMVQEVVTVSGFATIFPIHDTVDKALGKS